MTKVGHLSLMCFQARESATLRTRPFIVIPSYAMLIILPKICTYASLVTLELVGSVKGPSVE